MLHEKETHKDNVTFLEQDPIIQYTKIQEIEESDSPKPQRVLITPLPPNPPSILMQCIAIELVL